MPCGIGDAIKQNESNVVHITFYLFIFLYKLHWIFSMQYYAENPLIIGQLVTEIQQAVKSVVNVKQ